MAQVQRYLVKMSNASLSLAGQAAVLRARPFFGSITESRTASVVVPSIWHIVETPAVEIQLVTAPPDSASFGFLYVLTGLGVEAALSPQQAMLELEMLQLSQSAAIELILPDFSVNPAPSRCEHAERACRTSARLASIAPRFEGR